MNDLKQRIFVSYSSADRQEAQKILDLLGAAGLGAWLDEVSIGGGTTWSSEIVDAVKNCTAMILLCTPKSVSSRNVHQEIQLAWESNRPILPLILEPSTLDPKIEYALAGRQYINLNNIGQEIWMPKVLRALHDFGIELDKKVLSRLSQTHESGKEIDLDFLPPPTNLPHSLTQIIGREKELQDIGKLIFQTRLLTLSGTGGTGKTRLSIDAGHVVLNKFKAGVHFVPLAPIIEPSLVPSAIAQALDIREVQGQPLIASIKAFIYKKNLLLILDNLEHILSARHFVTELLESCPNLRILITSRVHLGIRGEHEYHVEPLALPKLSGQSKEELLHSPASQLFIERAQEIKYNFEVTNDDVESITRICHKLDGLPLAIELAASRIKMFSPKMILERMESWKNFLTSSSGDQPERHKTLYSTIEWSYNLLKKDEQELFNILGVFSGGFTIATAEALAEKLGMKINVLDGIGTLIDNSLIRSVADVESSSRFMMLETLREFAAERMKANGEEKQVRRAHAMVFADLAEKSEIPLLNQIDDSWNILIETEVDNFRTALRWSINSGELIPGMIIIGCIGSWFFRGPVAEGLRWAKELYDASDKNETTLIYAKFLRAFGQVYWGIGDVPNALVLFSNAAILVNSFEDSIEICDILIWSILCYIGSNFSAARLLFQRTSELAEKFNSQWHRGLCRFFLAIVETSTLNLKEAGELYETGILYSDNLPWLKGGSLMLYGAYLLAIQQIQKAGPVLEESLTLLTQVRDLKNQIAVMAMVAGIARLEKNFHYCSQIHKKAILLCQETGEMGGLFSHFCGIVLLLIETEQPSIALKLMPSADYLQRIFGVTPIPGTDIFTKDAPAKIEELKKEFDPVEFQKAWDEGAKLSANEAIEFACGVLDTIAS